MWISYDKSSCCRLEVHTHCTLDPRSQWEAQSDVSVSKLRHKESAHHCKMLLEHLCSRVQMVNLHLIVTITSALKHWDSSTKFSLSNSGIKRYQIEKPSKPHSSKFICLCSMHAFCFTNPLCLVLGLRFWKRRNITRASRGDTAVFAQ